MDEDSGSSSDESTVTPSKTQTSAPPAHRIPLPRKTIATRSQSVFHGSLSSGKSKEYLLASPRFSTSMKSKEQAQKYLAEHRFIPVNQDPSHTSLSVALLDLAHTAPGIKAPAAEIIRAVALILDSLPTTVPPTQPTNDQAPTVHLQPPTDPTPPRSSMATQTDPPNPLVTLSDSSNQHNANLEMQITRLQNVVKELQEITCDNRSSAESLTNTVDETRNDLRHATQVVNDTVEELASIPTSLKESIHGDFPLPTSPQTSPYRDALTSNVNNPRHTLPARPSQLVPLRGRNPPPQPPATTPVYPATDYARASAAIKDRQILLDVDPDHPTLRKDLTKRELIDFIQKAIAKLDPTNSPTIQIKAIATTKNGSPILELNSPEAATWLKDPIRKRTFLDHLGGKVQVKERLYQLVVPFLPTSVKTDDSMTLRAIERESDLTTHSIARMKWIKDPSRRSANQRRAHALISTTSPHAANHLIKEGLYLDQTRFHPRKDRKELIRCLKCQRWGHFSGSCTQKEDTCGICAHEHRDRNCNSFGTYFCINCDSHSHSSRDRDCPDFQRRCEELDARTPENAMPYFPTDEPWTQVLLPPRPSGPIVHAQPPQRAQEPRQRQLTLGKNPAGQFGIQAIGNSDRSSTDANASNSPPNARPRSHSSPIPEPQPTANTDSVENTTPKRPQSFPAPSPLHETPRPRGYVSEPQRPPSPTATPLPNSSPPSSPTPSFPGSLPMQNNPPNPVNPQ